MGALVTWLSWRTVQTFTSDAWYKIFGLVVAGLGLILAGGMCSGQYWPFVLFGSQEHVAGWLPMVVVFGVCELYWQQWIPTNGYGEYQSNMHDGLVCVFIWVIAVTSGLFDAGGWRCETKWVASMVGTGELMAIIIPVLVMVVVREGRHGGKIGLSVSAAAGVALAVLILVKSECRSALLGALLGTMCFVFLQVRMGWAWVAGVGTGIGLWFAAIMNDTMFERLLAVNPFKMGHGPRAQILVQFWEHGTPFLGWGPEQGRWIINQDIAGGQVNGIYDSFHFFLADMISMGGWLMLPIMVTGVWIMTRAVWSNRTNIRVAGYAGGMVAFLVVWMFNPPALVHLMTAGLCVGGVLAVDAELYRMIKL